MMILRKLAAAMREPDTLVVQIEYTDRHGNKTMRTVSPIRFVNGNRAILAYCLGRERPQRFEVSRISKVDLRHADDCQMPEPVVELES